MSAATETRAVQVITPPRGWPRPDLSELWRYRDLVYFLARRDIAVRYRQTAIGAAWAIIQPVAFAAVFGVFLTLIGRVPTDGVPYAVFALTGMSVWLFVSSSLELTASSTVQQRARVEGLLPAVRDPTRRDHPTDRGLPDRARGALRCDGHLRRRAERQHRRAAGRVPARVGVALGAGLWLSAMATRYRDVQHVVPFVVQIGLFVSPVLYR